MAYREIPQGSVEIQTGLWLYTYTKVISGVERTYRQLYSSEGYCFYNKTQEIYRQDENGDIYLVPDDEVLPTERIYMTFASLGIYTDVNDFVSVLADPSYEIVSIGNNTELA